MGDNQHCGIYAGDWDSYKDFSEIFDDAKHTSDMDPEKIKGNIEPGVPVHSTRIRVGRNIDGFGLSPGITKQQRIDVDKLKARCEELAVQPRGTRGESGGQTGHTYDISNKHRLGYSEVQLVQVMIDAVNTLWKEDLEL